MKKSILTILIASLYIAVQAEEMWHIVGTDDYIRKDCLGKIQVVEDSLMGHSFNCNNLPYVAHVSDLHQLYANVFDRLVQTGAMMPAGNGDIVALDEGLTSFYRSLWCLNEMPADGGSWIWNDVGVSDLQGCAWNNDNAWIKSAYARLIYNLNLQNTFLEVASSNNVFEEEQKQVRFVRALTAWYLLDLFPASHFTTRVVTYETSLMGREQLYSWLENELKDLISVLPDSRVDLYHVDADAARMLLARLYLNAEVYTGTPQWENASLYAAQVMAGRHSLHTVSTSAYSPYQELFMGNNDENGAAEEILLMLKQDGHDVFSYGGASFLINITRKDNGMPDYGLSNTAWKCWRAGYRLLQAFASDDELNTLKGTEYTMPSQLGDDRALFYADESYPVPSLSGTYNGDFTLTWSVNKFTNRYSTDPMEGPYTTGSSSLWPDMDIPLMRSAEAWLTYAEAQFRLGNTQIARNTIATLRSRAHAETPNTISEDYLLDEWLREFHTEGRRRVDLVRFHQFTGTSTRTWEQHLSVYAAAQQTFPTPDLMSVFVFIKTVLSNYFAQIMPCQNISEGGSETQTIPCEDCNAMVYYNEANNTYYTVNNWFNTIVGGASMGTIYPIVMGVPFQLELVDVPFTQATDL